MFGRTLKASRRGMTVALSVLLVAGLAPAGRGLAAPATDPDFSLTVSPTRLVVAAAGVHDEQHFDVENRGTRPLEVQVGKRDFVANQDGNMVFQPSAPYSASTWIIADPDRFQLAPHARQRVAVRIAVPEQPEPGDHQVALVFLVPAPGDGNNIRVNRGVGAPVFIAVPGPIDDSTTISTFTAPRFALTGPISFTTTVEDVGTVHRDFRGDGHRLAVSVADERVELPDLTVLRGSKREAVATWTSPPLWCVCHATIAIPGAGGTVAQAAVTVIILPLHLLGILVVALLILIFGGRFIRRRYRARILAAAAIMNAPGRHSSD